MIKLETAHIEEVRGIRKLDIDFQKGTFAISGPNGSGKSGVIDAIEFGLTGQIGRLTGRGTKGLSVAEHGPHVDKTKFPDASFVELKVFLPGIGKSATITRKVSSPKKPKIVPAGDDVKAALAEIADHPEITLSRREILRFILVEPTKRSEEIQTILKLDEIGETRGALNSAQNKLQIARGTATAQVQSSRDTLQLHLQIPALLAADLLEAVNKRRKTLGLTEIAELTEDTKLDAGLSAADKATEFNKQSALRDLTALSEAAKGFPDLAKKEAAAILADLAKLEADPALLAALQRRSFIEKGLELVDGPECPLCDTPWEDEQHLRSHLEAKLAKSEEARKLQQSLLNNGTAIAQEAIRAIGLLAPVQKLAETQGDGPFTALLTLWKASLETLKANLATVDGLTGLKGRLTAGWAVTRARVDRGTEPCLLAIRGAPLGCRRRDCRKRPSALGCWFGSDVCQGAEMRSFLALLFYFDYKCSTQPGFRKTFLVLTLIFVFLLWSPWRPLLCPVFGVCHAPVVPAGTAPQPKTKPRQVKRLARLAPTPAPVQIPAEPSVQAEIQP